MFCARIQDKIHDLQKHAKPMLTLFDAEGRELAANDHFYFADPLLSYTIPKTGTISCRCANRSTTATRAGSTRSSPPTGLTRPHVFPMAGNPGKMIEVEPVGSARS